jgi:hypothetical protein
MRFINIAHGDFIVLFCFVLLILTETLGLNPVIATLIILPVAFAPGFALQRFLLQRVVGENVLLVILVTFGLSVIIENGLLEGFGADTRKVWGGWMETATIALGYDINVGLFQVLTFIAAVALVGGLDLLLYRTGIGAKIRAVSGRRRRRQSDRAFIGARLCDCDGHYLRHHWHRRGLHVGLDQLRSGIRADQAPDRVRGDRSRWPGQLVGLTGWRHRAGRRAGVGRPVRHHMADALRPHGFSCRSGPASAGPVSEILNMPLDKN